MKRNQKFLKFAAFVKAYDFVSRTNCLRFMFKIILRQTACDCKRFVCIFVIGLKLT